MTALPGYQRKDSNTNRRLILASLTIPRGAKEIAAVVGVSSVTARTHLKVMHAAGEVHIARWFKASRFVWERIFAIGPGQDAPKPSRMTQQERSRAYAARRRLDPELQMQRDISRQAYELRHRAPRADPAAAWLTISGGNHG